MSLTVAPLSVLLSSKMTSTRRAVQIPKRRSGVVPFVEMRESCACSRSSSSLSVRPRVGVEESRAIDKGEGVEMKMIMLGLGIWIMMGSGDAAMALGFGEGPLVEEFWENMRRYGLYFFTVGTGALYTIFKPIYDLLKSPTSALFIILIISAFLYLLYLVLAAMIGLSDFSYQYAT